MSRYVSLQMPRILVVEDHDPIRTLLVAALRRESLEVDAARDGVAALELTSGRDYAVIILDLMMPRLNGFEFLDALRTGRRSTHQPVILVLTAFDDAHLTALDPRQVHAIIRKPFDVPQLATIVREVAALSNAQRDLPLPIETAGDFLRP